MEYMHAALFTRTSISLLEMLGEVQGGGGHAAHGEWCNEATPGALLEHQWAGWSPEDLGVRS